MAVDERARRVLFERLEETLGREAADTLMSQLSPTGWADVARRDDVAALGGRMDRLEGRMDQLEGRMHRLEGRIDHLATVLTSKIEQGDLHLLAMFRQELNEALIRSNRTVAFTMAGTVLSFAGVMLAAGHLG